MTEPRPGFPRWQRADEGYRESLLDPASLDRMVQHLRGDGYRVSIADHRHAADIIDALRAAAGVHLGDEGLRDPDLCGAVMHWHPEVRAGVVPGVPQREPGGSTPRQGAATDLGVTAAGVHLGDEGLDAERLARAMRNTTSHLSSDWTHPGNAAAIAVEYDRLAAQENPEVSR